jgi:hypothetical protein
MAKARRPTIAQQLTAVRVRNQRVEQVDDARGATITVQLAYEGLMKPLAKALRMRRARSYRLDGLGLSVYRRIDGAATLEQLTDWLAAEHRLSFHESRTLLMWYLQMLMEKGLVVIAGTERPAAGA